MLTVAKQAVYQKFKSDPFLKEILLSTGSKIIAETTKNDKIWGTGFNIGDSDASRPWAWVSKGSTNILGFALMWAREMLRLEQ